MNNTMIHIAFLRKQKTIPKKKNTKTFTPEIEKLGWPKLPMRQHSRIYKLRGFRNAI